MLYFEVPGHDIVNYNINDRKMGGVMGMALTAIAITDMGFIVTNNFFLYIFSWEIQGVGVSRYTNP